MIPEAAVEAAAAAIQVRTDQPLELHDLALAALTAAAPHMVIHVHHHDIEAHARSFNEGYETAVTQVLADDPTLADDWLNAKLAAAWDEAFEAGRDCGEWEAAPIRDEPTYTNPYRTAK